MTDEPNFTFERAAYEWLTLEQRQRLRFVKYSLLSGRAQFSEQSRSDDPTFDNRWLTEFPFKEAA